MSGSITDEIDALCEQFEDCQQSDSPQNLEAFLPAEWPAAARQKLRELLLRIELEYRSERGESISVSDLKQRFSDWPEVEHFAADLQRRYQSAIPISVLWSKLRETDLVPEPVLTELMSAVPPPRSSEVLLQELSRRKQLTDFQIQEIRSGNILKLRLLDYTLIDRFSDDPVIPDFKATIKGKSRLFRIRVLPLEFTSKCPDLIQCLREQVLLVKALSHPGLVKSRRVLKDADGTNALVSDHHSGIRFPDFMEKMPSFSIRAAVSYSLQIAKLLSYAHESGVTHGGLQLNSLMLDESGNVRVLDLGVFKALSECRRLNAIRDSAPALQGVQVPTLRDSATTVSRADRVADIQSLGQILLRLLIHSDIQKQACELSANSADIADALRFLGSHQPAIPGALTELLEKLLIPSVKPGPPELHQIISIFSQFCGSPRLVESNIRRYKC